jgi:hypothetical protein
MGGFAWTALRGIGVVATGLAAILLVARLAPAPRVEAPPPSPGPDAVWIAGYWTWRNGEWVWSPGRWETAQGRFYVPGRYRQTPQGWVWEPGRWQR